eukprot:TRINITY_DN999_c0_g1_i1.p1 TRINITY_DN999_c0_g1~~TRINITY_DN999_c0_g1_i1.p1  ORF type:complete len:668 (+),score=258.09 TRINITY_DN999_c0_g1_i1:32-2035(+)
MFFHRSLPASGILRRMAVRGRLEGPLRYSSSSSRGGGASPMSVAAAVSSAGLGGVVGYAFFDADFRKSMEKNVPGASEIFSSLFGPSSSPVEDSSSPSKALPPSPAASKLKITRIPEPVEIIETPKKAPQLTATKTPQELSKKKPEASPNPKESSSDSFVANIVKDKMGGLSGLLKDSSSAASAFSEATSNHMTLLQQAMEGTDEASSEASGSNTWDKVFNAASLKREANKKAAELIEKSNAAIKDLIHVVENGKKDLESKGLLAKAEEEIKQSVEDLQSLSNQMIDIQKSAKIVDDFRELIEKGKKSIQLEMASILPPGGPETKEEFELFIQHAYKKILSLQMELAKLKTLEQKKSSHVLENLKVEMSMETQNAIQSALDSQRLEFEKEITRGKQGVREEMEAELRTQLKRQAGAHFDHLNDNREIQVKEISRKYERLLHETLLKKSTETKGKMSEMMGAYEGLVSALEKRGKADENILSAQNFWLSATRLYQAVNKGGIPLGPEVEELKKHISSEEDKQLIEAVLKSVDAHSMNSGVLGEEEMRDRFLKVERLAGQTSMIGSEGASPLVYVLSYFQSMFLRSPASSLKAENLESLGTHELTTLARLALERGNIEDAVRYMTLLSGVPMNIAKDWIQDARRVLEVKQACEVIVAQASSSGVQFPPN